MNRDVYSRNNTGADPQEQDTPFNLRTPTGPPLGNVPAPDSYLRIKQNVEGLLSDVSDIKNYVSETHPLSEEQLKQIQKALEAGGPNPLDLTGLPGKPINNGASIPEVTSLSFNAQDGDVVLYRKVIWRFKASTRKWTPISTILLQDTHVNRISRYPAAAYAPGVLFWETDYKVLLIEQDYGSRNLWVPTLSTTLPIAHDVRVAQTGQANTTSVGNLYTVTRVSGNNFNNGWSGYPLMLAGSLYTVGNVANANSLTVLQDPGNQNNISFYFEIPSAAYPRGAFLYETDRTVIYRADNLTGTVSINTNNNVVTRVSGNSFSLGWLGGVIELDGNRYQVASVANNNSLTVVGGGLPSNNAGALFSMVGGGWYYSAGIYMGNAGTLEPSDLSPVLDPGYLFYNRDQALMKEVSNQSGIVYFGWRWGIRTGNLSAIPSAASLLDDDGYLYSAEDYGHLYQLRGVTWQFGPGDSGSGFIVAGTALPRGGANGWWQLCDGSSVAVATSNANTSNITTPDLTGGPFIRGGTYTGSANNASAPTWAPGAKTDTDNSNVVIQNGTGNNITVATSPHTHNLSNADANLNPPSDSNGGLPFNIKLQWYLRR